MPGKKVYFSHPYWDERVITSEDFESVNLSGEQELRIKPNGVGVEVSQAVFDYLIASEQGFSESAPTDARALPVEKVTTEKSLEDLALGQQKTPVGQQPTKAEKK